MRNLQNLSENLDKSLMQDCHSEAERLADSILASTAVQEDMLECCLTLLTYRAMFGKLQQETDSRHKNAQKEIELLSDQVQSVQKESAQLKQEVEGYRNEINSLRVHLQDRSFRMLQLYVQNAEQEEELAELRGLPASTANTQGMLSMQLQLKELEAEKNRHLDHLHQIQQQQEVLHKKIRKLKESIASGTIPVQKHMLAVLSMDIFQETLRLKEQEIQQTETIISDFDQKQEALAKKIESAFAEN